MWAAAAAFVAVVGVIGRADAEPPLALECADVDRVITTIVEPNDAAEGFESPGEAVRALLTAEFEQLDANAAQEVARESSRSTFAMSQAGKKRLLASVAKAESGWKPEVVEVCSSFLYEQKEGPR